MGITIHYEGTLRDAAALEELVAIARDFARTRGWPVEASSTDGERGLSLRPHERCEAVHLVFDESLHVRGFTKTQYAGPTVHLEVVRLFTRLKPLFATLEITDETGAWESGDPEDATRAFDESPLGWGDRPAAVPADDASGALDPAERVRELEGRLRDAQGPEGREELAWALTDLARTLRDLGDRTAAEGLFRRALAVREQLASDDSPDGRRDVARSHTDLAWLIAAHDRLPEAEAAHQSALKLREELHAQAPDRPEHARDLAATLADLARLARDAGRNGDAQSLFRRAAAALEKLVEGPLESEDRVDCATELAFALNSEARLLRGLGRGPDAEASLRKAAELRERLLAENPVHEDRPRWFARLGADLSLLGRWLEEDDRFPEAEPALARAVQSLNEVVATAGDDGGPLVEDATLDLVDALRTREVVLHNLGRGDDARDARRAATEARRQRPRS